MSNIIFKCSNCGQSLEAASDMLGETVNCPTCSSQISVISKGKLRLKTNSTDQSDKKCPYCNASLDHDAILCVSCGKYLDSGRSIKKNNYKSSATHLSSTNAIPETNEWAQFWKVILLFVLIGGGLIMAAMNWKTISSFSLKLKSNDDNHEVIKRNISSSNDGLTNEGSYNKSDYEDQQHFMYIKSTIYHDNDPYRAVELLNEYLQDYPKGAHRGEALALIQHNERLVSEHQAYLSEQERLSKFGQIKISGGLRLGAGRSMYGEGWVQIFTNSNYDQIKESFYAAYSRGLSKDLSINNAGKFISNHFKGNLVYSAELESSDHLVTEVPPGNYIIYLKKRDGNTGSVIFEKITVEAGYINTIDTPTFAYTNQEYDRDLLYMAIISWRPIQADN